MTEQNNELDFLVAEEVEMPRFTEDMQQQLKSVVDFMANLAIVEIKRCGEDRVLVRYVDGTIYSVEMARR